MFLSPVFCKFVISKSCGNNLKSARQSGNPPTVPQYTRSRTPRPYSHLHSAEIHRIVGHLIEKGNKKPVSEFTQDWAQDTIDRLLFPENYRQAESDEIYLLDKTQDFLKFKKISDQRHKSYNIIFNLIRRYELYTGKLINIDKATPDTLADLEDFFRNEHKLFEPIKEKYSTVLKPVKKYKYVWENSPHERAPKKRSDNALITYMSAVMAYWRWCIDMGYTKNDPFRKFSIGSQK